MVEIQHVSIEVDSALVSEEIAFWELLGFDPVEPPEGIGSGSVWMQAGGQQVHLLPRSAPALSGSGHLALLDEDFEGTVEALSKAGVEVSRSAEYWGSPRAKATSPSGHQVELMESAPT